MLKVLMNSTAPEKNCPDLQRGAPFVFQNVEADASKLVNVGVVDFCKEADLQQSVSLSSRFLSVEAAYLPAIYTPLGLPWGSLREETTPI